ncbi:hypothetical protein L1281_000424 [Neisseria sp. HSC-16F19]|nr:hypothetical protein [Neisseria sp. HSC-16F19]MCP2039854.1 hypothetical protein [Neisseria sp. HSC-16F19]
MKKAANLLLFLIGHFRLPENIRPGKQAQTGKLGVLIDNALTKPGMAVRLWYDCYSRTAVHLFGKCLQCRLLFGINADEHRGLTRI